MKGILVTLGGDVEAVDKLGPRTSQRLVASYELWYTGKYDYWVVTGSSCHPPDVQTIPTSKLMANWCLRLPEMVRPRIDQVHEVSTARETWEEVAGVMKFIHDRHLVPSEIMVVSEHRHLRRAEVIFDRAHNTQISTHPVNHNLSPTEVAIEAGMLLYTHFDPNGIGPLPWLVHSQRTHE